MAVRKIVRKTQDMEIPESANAMVPGEEVYKHYKGRKLPGGITDMDFLAYAQREKLNILLQGPTGSGKTHVSRAYAAKTRQRYYSLPCDVSIDPTSLFGKLTPQDDGSFAWVDGPITEMVRYGGVLNISEVNFMPPKIAAALYQLLDSRRQLTLLGRSGEVIDANPNLLIVADMNPNYRGTQQLNAAFMNRWPLKISWDYDSKVEAALVESKTLREIGRKFRAMFGTDLRTPVSTNMLMEFERFCLELGLDFAVPNFVQSFQPDEMQAVAKVFELSATELAAEIHAIWLRDNPGSASEAAEEESEEEFEDVEGFEDDEYEEDDEEEN